MHAIIGTGRVAINHVDAFRRCGIEIKYAIDVKPSVASAFASTHGIEVASSNLRRCLEDDSIDSVSICTGNGSHANLSISALEAGKHVLVEKPIATKFEDGAAMIEAAKRNDRVLSVVSQHRYDHLFQRIYELVRNGSFGPLVLLDGQLQCAKEDSYYKASNWRGSESGEGGSTLITQGIHTLDLMIGLSGTPKVVSSISSRFKFDQTIETEDTLACLFEFEHGPFGTFTSTNASTIGWNSSIKVVGLEGSVSFSTDFPIRLQILRLPNYPDIENDLRHISEEIEPAPIGQTYYGSSHRHQVRNFLDAVHKGNPLLFTPTEALQTLKVINNIYEVARTVTVG